MGSCFPVRSWYREANLVSLNAPPLEKRWMSIRELGDLCLISCTAGESCSLTVVDE